MNMKKYLKMPLYVASLALMTAGVASCSDDEGPGTSARDKREAALRLVVNDYVDRTVIPTYEQLADASVELHTACLAMYNAGVGNVTSAQVETAGEAWKKAREYWERSEAWLYGPAGDYNVDPHIDSWPLDQGLLDDLLANSSEMAKMDADGVYISSQDYGLLGFHAQEYMLFAIEGSGMSQTSVPHSTDYTAEELSYIAGVAGDLRNHCIFLEAAWVGEDNISSSKQDILAQVRSVADFAANNTSIRTVLTDLANGLCYADEMKNPTEGGGSDFVNYLAIENAYMGIQSSKDYNSGETLIRPVDHSLSAYVASLDADLDARVQAAITAAYDAISEMQEPFVVTCSSSGPYVEVNRAAITACNTLNDIFDEVLRLIEEQR